MTFFDQSRTRVSGEIIATDVSFEEYLEKYAGMHCELVGKDVIKVSPASLKHNSLMMYLHSLLAAYFELRPVGIVIIQPFSQRLDEASPKREPDLMIVLNAHQSRLKETYLDGPADICIEVVSPGTEDIDRGDKFVEYEKGGVGEYWIFDPLRRETLFYRLNDEGVYMPQQADTNGNYVTPVLPGLLIHVPTLWQNPLPGLYAVGDAVKAMLG